MQALLLIVGFILGVAATISIAALCKSAKLADLEQEGHILRLALVRLVRVVEEYNPPLRMYDDQKEAVEAAYEALGKTGD